MLSRCCFRPPIDSRQFSTSNWSPIVETVAFEARTKCWNNSFDLSDENRKICQQDSANSRIWELERRDGVFTVGVVATNVCEDN